MHIRGSSIFGARPMLMHYEACWARPGDAERKAREAKVMAHVHVLCWSGPEA
jgi:hypothetical protein